MFNINAELRKKFGKNANNRLRLFNKLPAIIYGKGYSPVFIEVNHNEIWNMQNQNEFYDNIINININGKKEKVKIQAIQRHAFKPKIIHIDFIRI